MMAALKGTGKPMIQSSTASMSSAQKDLQVIAAETIHGGQDSKTASKKQVIKKKKINGFEKNDLNEE